MAGITALRIVRTDPEEILDEESISLERFMEIQFVTIEGNRIAISFNKHNGLDVRAINDDIRILPRANNWITIESRT